MPTMPNHTAPGMRVVATAEPGTAAAPSAGLVARVLVGHGAPTLLRDAQALPALATGPSRAGGYLPVVTPNGTTMAWREVDGVKVAHLVAAPAARTGGTRCPANSPDGMKRAFATRVSALYPDRSPAPDHILPKM